MSMMPSPEDKPAETLDTRGMLCPLPVLKLRKRLQPLAPGTRIEVLADDPAAWIDVPHFCTEQGHRLISQEKGAADTLVFIVQKAG